ncbi:hypothetical protein [Fluviispira sanaruensis]|uniref:Lipoprotein n=1 Tax=Fluviispira sanaruensis TaxID=2493639 RepID=A0A4P2VTR5_FLUSA|nr:hypothetical protein [Fluviispira sanaruensis]BBH52272.1 hypothetical protein JCM31447_07130 [Fluviispira sanaruensis]
MRSSILTLSLFLSSSAFACLSGTGPSKMQDEKIDCVMHTGSIAFKNVTVGKNFENAGSVDLIDSQIQGAFINTGHVSLDKVSIVGSFVNTGSVELKDSKIQADFDNTGIVYIENGFVAGDFKNTGKVKLQNVENLGDIDITGKFNAWKIKSKNISIIGQTEFSGQSIVSGNAFVNGDLTAKETIFKDKIEVTAEIVKLYDSVLAKDIYFRKNKNDKYEQEYLYINNSTVHGNIEFESGKGNVIISNGGKVKGKIIGASVKNNS